MSFARNTIRLLTTTVFEESQAAGKTDIQSVNINEGPPPI